MRKLIGFVAAFAFLCSSASIAIAADNGGWVSCKDGLQVRGERACEAHGGVVLAKSTSTPIDASKGPVPNKTAAKKTKTQKVAATTTKKKTVAKRTNTPTAKCMDGAMYFSTERRGACLKHGGVRSWYI
jgi:Protein of unknown function (DUF3761)